LIFEVFRCSTFVLRKTWKWWSAWYKEKYDLLKKKKTTWGEIRQESVVIRDSPVVLVTNGKNAGFAYDPKDYLKLQDTWKFCCHDANYCNVFRTWLAVSNSKNYQPPKESKCL
jgi:hypothetical protein